LKRLAVDETTIGGATTDGMTDGEATAGGTTVGGATTDGTTDGEATAGGTAISLLQIVGYT